jgi:hypothetical protein
MPRASVSRKASSSCPQRARMGGGLGSLWPIRQEAKLPAEHTPHVVSFALVH